MRQYLYIYNKEDTIYSANTFANMVLNNEIKKDKLIKIKNFVCKEYGRFIFNNEIYNIGYNVLKDNINYIAVCKS
jgi:hypothetical protein